MTAYRRAILMLPLLSAAFSTIAASGGASQALLKGTMSIGVANNLYKNIFVLNSTPLPNAAITKVFWQYSLSQQQIPAGGTLQVYLCQSNTNNCVDISSAQSGMTSYFAGHSPQQPFYLYYRVSGRVAMRHVQGVGDTQLNINYDIP